MTRFVFSIHDTAFAGPRHPSRDITTQTPLRFRQLQPPDKPRKRNAHQGKPSPMPLLEQSYSWRIIMSHATLIKVIAAS